MREVVAMEAGASSHALRWRRPPLQSNTSPVWGSIMRLFTEKSRPAASLHTPLSDFSVRSRAFHVHGVTPNYAELPPM